MARLAERALSGPCQAALLGLLLEDMPGQQLALCVAQRFELGADLEFVVVWLGVDYPGPQFEAEPCGNRTMRRTSNWPTGNARSWWKLTPPRTG